MNKLNIFKKLSIKKRLAVGLATMGAGLLLASNLGASAIPFTGDTTVASPVPAFNVFTGNIPAPAPAAGESDFFQARVPANGNLTDPTTPYTDPVTTDCTNGKIVQLHVYVHNGASAAGNNSGASIAHNTKVRVNLPTSDIVNHNAAATISADNATSVTDGVAINCNGQKATLKYVNGSAAQFSLGSAGQVALPDSIVTTGAAIRSEQVPGDVWGCWEERVFVVLNVQIVVTPPPAPAPVFTCDVFTLVADVNRTAKVSTFSTTATNGAVFKNAVIDWGDGSTPLTTATPVGATHQFATDGPFTVKATAHFTVNNADVTATSAACQQVVNFVPNQPPAPVFTCDLFTIQSDATNRVVKITALNTTAKNGAVFSHATINWGDNSTPLSITNAAGQTHQFAADGTFTIIATAHFTVNGQDVTATSPACQKQVVFKAVPPPVNPVFTCDKFLITADANRMVKVSAFAVTATGGVTFSHATINWGDNTPATNVNSVAGVIGQTHQFNADGTFTITATATFLVNGQQVTAGGPQCQAIVKFVPNQVPETPVFSCDKFDIQAEANRTVKVTGFATTATGGATFAIASIDWGDNTTPLSTNNVVGQTHQFAKDGTFVVTATAHFTVDGKDLVAGSVKCQKQVTFAPNVPPVVTPPTVTPPAGTLVNTGPGANLAVMFAVVTAVSMLAYRSLLARSLRG